MMNALPLDYARPCCSVCGSDDIVRDAWARWDQETGGWELDAVFDEVRCETCDASADVVWTTACQIASRGTPG